MDHKYLGQLGGSNEGFKDSYYSGRRPAGVYIPRFRNLGNDVQQNFIRGYAFAAGGGRDTLNVPPEAIGAEIKSAAAKPGDWHLWMTGMGECLPYFENKVTLSPDKKDAWDMPLLQIDCEYKANEENMLKDLLQTGSEMLENAGFKNIRAF